MALHTTTSLASLISNYNDSDDELPTNSEPKTSVPSTAQPSQHAVSSPVVITAQRLTSPPPSSSPPFSPPTSFLPACTPSSETVDGLAIKLEKYWKLKEQGTGINSKLRQSKAFNNPDILEKLIAFVGIKEAGTHFSREVFNPSGFAPSDFYDQLSVPPQQRTSNRIDFQPGGTSVLTFPSQVIQQRNETKDTKETKPGDEPAPPPAKRSKWDVTLPTTGQAQAVPVQPVSQPVPTDKSKSSQVPPLSAYADYARKRRESERAKRVQL